MPIGVVQIEILADGFTINLTPGMANAIGKPVISVTSNEIPADVRAAGLVAVQTWLDAFAASYDCWIGFGIHAESINPLLVQVRISDLPLAPQWWNS